MRTPLLIFGGILLAIGFVSRIKSERRKYYYSYLDKLHSHIVRCKELLEPSVELFFDQVAKIDSSDLDEQLKNESIIELITKSTIQNEIKTHDPYMYISTRSKYFVKSDECATNLILLALLSYCKEIEQTPIIYSDNLDNIWIDNVWPTIFDTDPSDIVPYDSIFDIDTHISIFMHKKEPFRNKFNDSERLLVEHFKTSFANNRIHLGKIRSFEGSRMQFKKYIFDAFEYYDSKHGTTLLHRFSTALKYDSMKFKFDSYPSHITSLCLFDDDLFDDIIDYV